MSGLIDPDYETELADQAQTIAFLKKAFAGILYAELTPAGRVIAGVVKKGGGDPVTAPVVVMIQVASAGPAPITGASGPTGLLEAVTTTDAAGVFSVTIGGLLPAGVVVTPHHGVASVVTV